MAERDPIELAARSLHYRDRSRSELDARLARAGIDEDARADALDTLERVGYVDDARFAAVRAAALAGRGYGDEAIRHDLAGHQLRPEAIEAGLATLEAEAARASSSSSGSAARGKWLHSSRARDSARTRSRQLWGASLLRTAALTCRVSGLPVTFACTSPIPDRH